MRYLVPCLLLSLVACRTGRDSLPDGAGIPDGMAVFTGKLDFDTVNWEREMRIRQVGAETIVLQPKTKLFAIPIPPGRYKIEHIDCYESRKEDLFLEAKAGEAVYIGSWYAVLGLDTELEDELNELRPEIESRWSVGRVAQGMPGKPRRIVWEADLNECTGPEYDDRAVGGR